MTRNIARMASLLREMEIDAGLDDLSHVQKDVYYSYLEASVDQKLVSTEAIRHQVLSRDISHPTFFRALKELVTRGLIEPDPDHGRGYYRPYKLAR